MEKKVIGFTPGQCKWTAATLRQVRDELCAQALRLGRCEEPAFPNPYQKFVARKRKVPFDCLVVKRLRPQIAAVERALALFEAGIRG